MHRLSGRMILCLGVSGNGQKSLFEANGREACRTGWNFGSRLFKSGNTWIFSKTRSPCARAQGLPEILRRINPNTLQSYSHEGWHKLTFKFLILWRPQTSQMEGYSSSFFWSYLKASHPFLSLSLALSVTTSKSLGIFKREGTYLFILLQMCSEARNQKFCLEKGVSGETRDSKTSNKQK